VRNEFQIVIPPGNRRPLSLLLASAKREKERELYRSRVEREQRLLDELQDRFPDRFAA
jgi:hypothetical protein